MSPADVPDAQRLLLPCRPWASGDRGGPLAGFDRGLADVAAGRAHREPLHTPGRYRVPPREVHATGPRDADEVPFPRLETDLGDDRGRRPADGEEPLPVGPRDGMIEIVVGVGAVEDPVGDVVDAQVEPGVVAARPQLGARPRDGLVGDLPVDVEPLGIDGHRRPRDHARTPTGCPAARRRRRT
jgi:hypothetical protein